VDLNPEADPWALVKALFLSWQSGDYGPAGQEGTARQAASRSMEPVTRAVAVALGGHEPASVSE